MEANIEKTTDIILNCEEKQLQLVEDVFLKIAEVEQKKFDKAMDKALIIIDKSIEETKEKILSRVA